MDDLVRWLGEQLDAEAERTENAGAAAGGEHWFAHSHQTGRRTARWYVGASPAPGTSVTSSKVVRTEHRSEVARHIAAQDPARVLREIEAKRQLLDEHTDVNDGSCGTCVDGAWGYPTHGGSSPQRYPCKTLRLLALPHADRPGYLEKWRP